MPPTALVLCVAFERLGWLSLMFTTELGLGILLFAFPACVTIGYSAGMALTRMKRRLIVGFACLAAFVALALLIHATKPGLVAHIMRIRQVWGHDSITLPPGTGGICGAGTHDLATGITVRPGAVLESVRTVVCVNGELVTDRHLTHTELTDAGGFELERVRVIVGGPNGAEGWVVSSHLHRPVTSSAD